jgi:hypothetical protein
VLFRFGAKSLDSRLTQREMWQVIIVTSSLMKDMNSKTDLYRANAIRVLCRITDGGLLSQIERYLKQAVVDKNPVVSSAALVSGIHLLQVYIFVYSVHILHAHCVSKLWTGLSGHLFYSFECSAHASVLYAGIQIIKGPCKRVLMVLLISTMVCRVTLKLSSGGVMKCKKLFNQKHHLSNFMHWRCFTRSESLLTSCHLSLSLW